MNRGQFIKGVTSALAFAKVLDLAADSEDGSALAAQKKWFQEAQYGMMVHWGLYSLLGGEWKGRAMRKPSTKLKKLVPFWALKVKER